MSRTEGRIGIRPANNGVRYLVACLVAATTACTSATFGSGSAPVATMRLTGLHASQPHTWRADGRGWSVTLRWPSLGGDIRRYAVRRDGELLRSAIHGTTFVDRRALPGSSYIYSVVGVDPAGRSTRPASVAIRTHQPPRSQGRLGGVFLTRLHLVKSHGLAIPPSGGAFTFVFHPECGRGPCGVHWRVGERPTAGRMARHDETYRGVVQGPFQIRSCTGATIDERLLIRVRVTDAAMVGRDWRATRFEGSLVESSRVAGCVPAGITWTLRGAIQT
jgi:hypothetical protein